MCVAGSCAGSHHEMKTPEFHQQPVEPLGATIKAMFAVRPIADRKPSQKKPEIVLPGLFIFLDWRQLSYRPAHAARANSSRPKTALESSNSRRRNRPARDHNNSQARNKGRLRRLSR
jgi:hypothetical protein